MPVLPVIPVASLPFTPRAVHLFFDAAILFEIAFFPLDETADEYIALMGDGDGDIRYSLVASVLDSLAVDDRVKMSLAESTGLVDCAVTIAQELVGKEVCDIIDALCFPEGQQCAIIIILP